MTDTSFPPDAFQRMDETDDHEFYRVARKVEHIDGGAIAALKEFYRKRVPPHGEYLDLMSSWRSHLPDDLEPIYVVGLGMNAEEMADNPQLDEYIVHNLNQTPTIPYQSVRFDAVLCAVSVQYLIRPVAVFAEVNRVLKPGGVFVVSFSNRCFPTKAVSVWMNTGDRQHVALIARYFELAGRYTDLFAEAAVPGTHDPVYVVSGKKML